MIRDAMMTTRQVRALCARALFALAAGMAVPAPAGAASAASTCPKAPQSVPNSPGPAIPPVGDPVAAPSLSGAWPPLAGLPPRCPAVPLVGSHATYNVGPGKQYADLTGVPWLNLVAGDVVNIYYRSTPYATKIALRASGTASKPVIINGVADARGNLPQITGNRAVTATDSIKQAFYTSSGGLIIEEYGVIVMFRGVNDAYGYKPTYVTIQNLRITGGAAGNTYTDHTGAKRTYPSFTAAIYVVASQYLTVQNNELFGNGLGVFVNDQNDLAGSSFFTTVRGNYIHDNGVVNDWSEHNVYVQGARSLYEGNTIGQLIPGAPGSSLKDRSSGPVVRYNTIIAAARALDLVEPQGGSPGSGLDTLHDTGWAYGNLIIDDFNNPGFSSGDLIHWGGDSTIYDAYHKGPLYFYDNTIYIRANQQQAYWLAVFDLPTSKQTIVLANNIIAHSGASEMRICTNSLSDGTKGSLVFQQTNWIAPYVNGTVCNVKTSAGKFLPGSPALTSRFRLPAGSAAIGAGAPFPPATLSLPKPASVANLQVTAQFATLPGTTVVQPTYVARPTVTDLGAFSYP